jgi:hypothetical protein
MTCYVYWIHREVHTDPTTEGYIGITTEFDRRMWKHFRNPSNIHLARALQKYDDIKKDILWEGSRDECLLSEFFLRPDVGIGWNINRGGGMPPLLTELPQFDDIRQQISDTLKRKKIPPNLERLHSPEAIAKRRETAKQSARKWIYNPETGEAKQIRTALGEGVPDGWKLGKKYVQPVKASVRGVDYHCNAKVWEVTTPEGTTTQVSSLKTWCRENGYNFYEVYNSKNGWSTKKK